MLHIYAALAEKERVLIADRTRAALAQKKARGSPPCRRCPPVRPQPQDLMAGGARKRPLAAPKTAAGERSRAGHAKEGRTDSRKTARPAIRARSSASVEAPDSGGESPRRMFAISATGSSKGNCGASHQLPSNWPCPRAQCRQSHRANEGCKSAASAVSRSQSAARSRCPWEVRWLTLARALSGASGRLRGSYGAPDREGD
jgi:hypothetical protein